MRLEPEFWDALHEVARREKRSLDDVVQGIEQTAWHSGSRTSAIRVFVVNYFRQAATEDGHQRAGHGRGGSHRWPNSNQP